MSHDDDDAPEWSPEVFARAEIKRGGEVVKQSSGALTRASVSMLEKAARALARDRVDPKGVMSDEHVAPQVEKAWANEYTRAHLIRDARAVLMAVREPSDPMILSAAHLTDADAYEAFTAMIDAILNETAP